MTVRAKQAEIVERIWPTKCLRFFVVSMKRLAYIISRLATVLATAALASHQTFLQVRLDVGIDRAIRNRLAARPTQGRRL
jgi:hypothetical protein